jgi:hypothetical protein
MDAEGLQVLGDGGVPLKTPMLIGGGLVLIRTFMESISYADTHRSCRLHDNGFQLLPDR